MRAPTDPGAQCVKRTIPPNGRLFGEGRPGPQVPSGHVHSIRLDHPTAIDTGYRIVVRHLPIAQNCFQRLMLQIQILPAVRPEGQREFRGFHIRTQPRLIGAVVDSGDIECSEANRL